MGWLGRSDRSRRRRVLAVLVVALGLSSACSARSDVEVFGVWVSNDDTELTIEVNTCNQSTTVVSVDESVDAIVVTSTTGARYGCSGDDCSDLRTVELSDPVGARRIVDGDGNDVRRTDG